jgi:hypothetical protein
MLVLWGNRWGILEILRKILVKLGDFLFTGWVILVELFNHLLKILFVEFVVVNKFLYQANHRLSPSKNILSLILLILHILTVVILICDRVGRVLLQSKFEAVTTIGGFKIKDEVLTRLHQDSVLTTKVRLCSLHQVVGVTVDPSRIEQLDKEMEHRSKLAIHTIKLIEFACKNSGIEIVPGSAVGLFQDWGREITIGDILIRVFKACNSPFVFELSYDISSGVWFKLNSSTIMVGAFVIKLNDARFAEEMAATG